MNEQQQMFHDFALKRVIPGKETELEAIMAESFKKQDEGTFTPEYMSKVVQEIIALIRPEFATEFKQAAAHMRSRMG